ncbi:unnamed protein product [Urochloa humidicola]
MQDRNGLRAPVLSAAVQRCSILPSLHSQLSSLPFLSLFRTSLSQPGFTLQLSVVELLCLPPAGLLLQHRRRIQLSRGRAQLSAVQLIFGTDGASVFFSGTPRVQLDGLPRSALRHSASIFFLGIGEV